MTVQDLRDVLRERAEAPSPTNPRRHDQVAARVRRTRLRRRVTAGAAVAAAVVVGVSLLPGAAEQPRETTAAARPVPELPERFTADDGTEYRRLTTLTMKGSGPKKSSVTVPVSGRPLEVAGICDGELGGLGPRILVNGRPQAGSHIGLCFKRNAMELRPVTMPTGATEVTIGFDKTVNGCVLDKKGGQCVPSKPDRTDWRLGVYEWTPPVQPVEPAPLKAFPGKLGRLKLAGQTSGVWDRDRSFEIVVKSPSGKIALEQLCSGDLASRVWFTYKVDGMDTGTGPTCVVWKQGPFPMAATEFTVPKGKRVTITGRVGMWGDSTNRPVRWSVAVYVR
ncbi:hypothetical protein EDD27_2828 [Nonomuraea polychroma]|uniref:Uncharacterized protein n=1 Tax=Nonomuraea polychroma TaxID=46176 RepID=A0A438M450_9ACTN|nr:hypothetical protein [Nonomuraea polychroma]RVX40421.1 hypothetical protein EDD27_2828 [Nonomuraea polychroma]